MRQLAFSRLHLIAGTGENALPVAAVYYRDRLDRRLFSEYILDHGNGRWKLMQSGYYDSMSYGNAAHNAAWRSFVAISVPEPVRRELEREQAELKKLVPSRAARWSKTEQIHLTLRFLGNVEVSRIPELVAALKVVCGSLAPLNLQAAGLGFFPEARVPRVLWAGVPDKGEQLSRVWAAVQSATQRFTGEEPEKRFSGHITLARLSGLNCHEAKSLGKTVRALQQKVFGEWTARELKLVRSQLFPQGARHEVVAAIDFFGK